MDQVQQPAVPPRPKRGSEDTPAVPSRPQKSPESAAEPEPEPEAEAESEAMPQVPRRPKKVEEAPPAIPTSRPKKGDQSSSPVDDAPPLPSQRPKKSNSDVSQLELPPPPPIDDKTDAEPAVPPRPVRRSRAEEPKEPEELTETAEPVPELPTNAASAETVEDAVKVSESKAVETALDETLDGAKKQANEADDFEPPVDEPTELHSTPATVQEDEKPDLDKVDRETERQIGSGNEHTESTKIRSKEELQDEFDRAKEAEQGEEGEEEEEAELTCTGRAKKDIKQVVEGRDVPSESEPTVPTKSAAWKDKVAATDNIEDYKFGGQASDDSFDEDELIGKVKDAIEEQAKLEYENKGKRYSQSVSGQETLVDETAEDNRHPIVPPRPRRADKIEEPVAEKETEKEKEKEEEKEKEKEEKKKPAPPPKPKNLPASSRVGALRASLFSDLDNAISNKFKAPPPPPKKIETGEAKVYESVGEHKEEEEEEEQGAAAEVEPEQPRRPRARGPKRRLPASAKSEWATVIGQVWDMNMEAPLPEPQLQTEIKHEPDHDTAEEDQEIEHKEVVLPETEAPEVEDTNLNADPESEGYQTLESQEQDRPPSDPPSPKDIKEEDEEEEEKHEVIDLTAEDGESDKEPEEQQEVPKQAQ